MSHRIMAAVAAAILAGGTLAGLQLGANAAARSAVDAFGEALPAGSRIEYASVTADLFEGGARLENFKLTFGEGSHLLAASVEVGPVREDGENRIVETLHATDIVLVSADGSLPFPVRLAIERAAVAELHSQPLRDLFAADVPGWPVFGSVEVAGLTLDNETGTLVRAARGRIGATGEDRIGPGSFESLEIPMNEAVAGTETAAVLRFARVESSALDFVAMRALTPDSAPEAISRAIAATDDSRAIATGIVGLRDGVPFMSIDSITAESRNTSDGANRQILQVNMLRVDDAQLGGAQDNLLRDLGYDELLGSLALELLYDVPSRRFAMPRFSLDLRDAARLELGLAMGGLPARFMTFGFIPSAAELRELTFEEIAFTLDDASLTARIAEMIGSRQGLDGDIYRQAQAISLRRQAAEAGAPQIRDVLNAVADFLEAPDVLAVRATPAQALTLGELRAAIEAHPFAALALLEVAAEAR